jgi:hypothetical protein
MFNTYKINKKEIYISNHMMNGYYLFKSLLEIIFSIDSPFQNYAKFYIFPLHFHNNCEI